MIGHDLLVIVEEGTVRGRSSGGVASFLGVPYAAPPVGQRRYREPEQAEPWEGVRDALEPGPTRLLTRGSTPDPAIR